MGQDNTGFKRIIPAGFASGIHANFGGFLPWIQYLAPYVLGSFAVIFFCSTVSHGHLFNEDYAIYLKEAWNIGHHLSIRNMGVVQYHDPAFPRLNEGPLTYPVGVPALFAVPVLIFGYDLYALKIIQLAFLGLALLIFPAIMRKWRFNTLEICASIIFFCFSYELRRSVNSIGSDIPFILFLLVTLYAIDMVVQKDRPGAGRLVLTGLMICLCLAVRTVAVILPLTLVFSDLLAHRRFRFPVICIPATILILLFSAQYFLGMSGESYGFILNYQFFTPGENLRVFYWALAAPLADAQVPRWVIGLLIALAIPATVAVVYEACKGTVLAIFLVSYTGMLLVLPTFDLSAGRYLLPQLLVFGAFAVRGTAIVSKLVYYEWRPFRFAPVATAAGILIFVAFVPSPLPSGHWNFGVSSASARELFSFIKNTTPVESVVAGTRFRSLHLWTDRTTIRLPAQPSHLADWLRAYSVSYLVIKYSEPKVRYDFSDCPQSLLCQGDIDSFGLELIFKNSDFAVFSIGTSDRAPGARSETSVLK
jgi:hypothetical protein